MADILKINTPIVDRTPITQPKTVDPSMPFDLSDISKVIQTNESNELMEQNTGLLNKDDGPKLLTDLIKNPAVSASIIRNIFMLQEIANLLPAQNTPLTEEIQQLFDQLMLNPDSIVEELMRQEDNTTLFKGDLFDSLRSLFHQTKGDFEISRDIGTLLRSLTAHITNKDAMDSVANNLIFIRSNFSDKLPLSQTLDNLINAFRAPNAEENFHSLKSEALRIFAELKQSPLLTQSIDKTITLGVYNLSRYNDSEEFFPTALAQLMEKLPDGAAKDNLVKDFVRFFENVFPDWKESNSKLADSMLQYDKNTNADIGEAGKEAATNTAGNKTDMESNINKENSNEQLNLEKNFEKENLAKSDINTPNELIKNALDKGAKIKAGSKFPLDITNEKFKDKISEKDSTVMKTLTKIIDLESKNDDLRLVSGDNIEKIVQSLLSSPSNFTPLLHFIIPVMYEDMPAFAEMWIDPNANEEDNGRPDAEPITHAFIVIDIPDVGKFELELAAKGNKVSANMMCPPEHVDRFKYLGVAVRKTLSLSDSKYSFESVNVDVLEKDHSLMDVFKDLPKKRTGINARI